MTPLHKVASSSVSKQLGIVFMVLAIILALPCVTIMSITNVGALVPGPNGISAGTIFTDDAIPEDSYAYGNCTYWAALRRIQTGQPIPNTWGNAATWAVRALLDGYEVNQTPSIGAIMQTPNSAGGLGHVAFVESVDPVNGTWTISEMNVVGWDITDVATYPPEAAVRYSFIHTKVH